MSEVTRILHAIEGGDRQAADELLPIVYEELRRLAARKLSHEPAGQTITASDLVHEAYLRLVGAEDPGWDNRRHFFAAAAEAMRRILVERARRKRSEKHGGGLRRLELNEAVLTIDGPSDDLLALDEALDDLAGHDAAKAELVKLRFFAGLTHEQAAAALGVSAPTAKRYWAYARAWLLRRLDDGR